MGTKTTTQEKRPVLHGKANTSEPNRPKKSEKQKQMHKKLINREQIATATNQNLEDNGCQHRRQTPLPRSYSPELEDLGHPEDSQRQNSMAPKQKDPKTATPQNISPKVYLNIQFLGFQHHL